MAWTTEHSGRSIGTLATLLLFGIFTLSAAALTVVGAQVYQAILEDTRQNNNQRASCAYLMNRLRSVNGPISIEQYQGGSMLVMEEEISGEQYLTRVYLHEGYLTESFLPAVFEFDPDNGEQIIEASDFQLKQEGALFQCQVKCGEEVYSFSVKSRGEETTS